ncbi:MAG: beta-lactamase family protein [Spirochaetales bacterium]|nr:beta-lactamase family protein [Spirochaetales bacterium]
MKAPHTIHPELDNGRLSAMDRLISGYIGSAPGTKQIPGVCLRVTRREEVVYDRCFGYVDAESTVPMSPETIMCVYSMTKPVTAVAAMMLYERGAFTLNDPVKEYIPAFSSMRVLKSLEGPSMDTVPAVRDITIRHLLTMTSGIAYGLDPEHDKLDALIHPHIAPPAKDPAPVSREDLISRIASFPLAFQPGTDYRYGLSHDVLGRIIECIAGMPLGDFFQTGIFEPLGMKDTGFFLPQESDDRFAGSYRYDTEERTQWPGFVNPRDSNAFQSGGGGLVSTTGDYSRFLRMLAGGGVFRGSRLLGRKTVALMTRNHLNPRALDSYQGGGREGYGYGLGVRVLMDPGASGINGSVGEFGWGGMAGTWMMVDPDEELTFLFMTQMFPPDYLALRRKCVQILYGALE